MRRLISAVIPDPPLPDGWRRGSPWPARSGAGPVTPKGPDPPDDSASMAAAHRAGRLLGRGAQPSRAERRRRQALGHEPADLEQELADHFLQTRHGTVRPTRLLLHEQPATDLDLQRMNVGVGATVARRDVAAGIGPVACDPKAVTGQRRLDPLDDQRRAAAAEAVAEREV